MSIDNPTTPLDRALGAEERANHRVCDLEDLRDELQAKVTRLQGETGVLRELLGQAQSIIATLEPECTTEGNMLTALQRQIEAAITPQNIAFLVAVSILPKELSPAARKKVIAELRPAFEKVMT